MTPAFEREYACARSYVEQALSQSLNGGGQPYEPLYEAMRYSLLAGGKRLRPILVLKFCEACGGTWESAVSAACGIEMLHTYSLIHDDLPCMDNDELRRGKPTCHKAFGETTAVLAGDALQCAAFEAVLNTDTLPERRAAMALALAKAAGPAGMCGGQYMDTVNENTAVSPETLCQINALKTGALLRAACEMGAICAGAPRTQLSAAREYAENLGLAFQIRDDVLDTISTEAELGKDIGSDAASGKTTYAALFGLEECGRMVEEYTARAKKAVAAVFPRPQFLMDLADSLADRRM